MTGADAIAGALRAAGVEVAFGLPGVHNLALWPAFERAGIEIVGSRHEQGCAYAADGYARTTGKVGVVLVTTGPGAANTLGAVGEAWASHAPVVVIATDIPSTMRRKGAYRGVLHETTDQAALFAPVTKRRTKVSRASQVEAAVSRAVHDALLAPAGPAYVQVPTDLLGAKAGTSASGTLAYHGEIDVAPVLALLAAAKRPLLWVGGGARDAGTLVGELASAFGAPVVTSYQGRGVLPAGHPMLVPAPPHEPEVTELVASADLAVVIGSDLDQMNTMAWELPLPERRVAINVDAADAAKNYSMDAVVEARAEDALPALIAATRTLRDPWAGDLVALGKTIRERLRSEPEHAAAVAFLEHTEAALGDDSVVFADMCIAGYWLAGHLRVPSARSLHYPVGWGTLGYAFPAAIGAAVANRGTDRSTVAFCGDGGMLFAVGELAALAQERLPLTVVVVDDGGYGMLRFGHEDVATGSDLSPVDFVTVARGFGVDAVAVDGFGTDYEAALRAAITAGAPRLVHVRAHLYPPVSTSPRWPMRST